MRCRRQELPGCNLYYLFVACTDNYNYFGTLVVGTGNFVPGLQNYCRHQKFIFYKHGEVETKNLGNTRESSVTTAE